MPSPAGPPESDDPDAGELSGGGDEELEELTVTITPRPAVLEELQVTEAEFETALVAALDRLEDLPDEEEPAPVEEMEIQLSGRLFRLEEVADVEIEGDLSELGELPDPADPLPGESDGD